MSKRRLDALATALAVATLLGAAFWRLSRHPDELIPQHPFRNPRASISPVYSWCLDCWRGPEHQAHDTRRWWRR